MPHLSLYRKYRSQSFGDLIGQSHVVKTLQNALDSGRLAHAYLFTGPRGTGKTSSARLLAKALCCEKGPKGEPCNECDNCISITEGSCMDVIEKDAASETGVDSVREGIVEAAAYMPSICRYKIYIIDEVHDLSKHAFDALLKTIEEPPAHIVFILATTEFHKVPPTIRSRCQKFEFHRASVSDLVKCLARVVEAENVEADPAALGLIARMADGGYRDALSLLEQVLLVSEGKVSPELVFEQLGLISDDVADTLLKSIASGDVPTLLTTLTEVSRLGRDPRSIVDSLLLRLADLTRVSYGLDVEDDPARQAAFHAVAAAFGREKLLELRTTLAEVHATLKDISLPKIWLESRLVSMATVGSAPPRPTAQPLARAPETPKVVEPPRPDTKAVEAPKAVVQAPAPTGNPDLDAAQDLWHRFLTSIESKDGKVPPIAMRLEKSSVVEVNGTKLTIEVSNFDLDWLTEKPIRTKFVTDGLERLTNERYLIEYRGSSKKSDNSAPETVELPLEGQRLTQKTREMFGAPQEK